MKKLALTIAIVLTMGLGTYAQDRGLLGRGVTDGDGDVTTPMIPAQHGLTTDQDGDAPMGSGVAVLLGLGAAYMVAKKRKED
jgi:hypothetical protein